jgi:hypothetical protein
MGGHSSSSLADILVLFIELIMFLALYPTHPNLSQHYHRFVDDIFMLNIDRFFFYTYLLPFFLQCELNVSPPAPTEMSTPYLDVEVTIDKQQRLHTAPYYKTEHLGVAHTIQHLTDPDSNISPVIKSNAITNKIITVYRHSSDKKTYIEAAAALTLKLLRRPHKPYNRKDISKAVDRFHHRNPRDRFNLTKADKRKIAQHLV